MHVERHGWPSPRLGKWMGINVYGHYGSPIVVFPTSGGDENEYAGQGMIDALAPPHRLGPGEALLRELGEQRVLVRQAGPPAAPQLRAGVVRRLRRRRGRALHLRPMPLSRASPSPPPGRASAPITPPTASSATPTSSAAAWPSPGSTTSGASWAATTTTTSTSTTPSTTSPTSTDPWYLHQLAQDDIRLATGSGAYEDSGPTYRLSEVLRPGHPPHRGRLGPGRRPRLALLEEPDEQLPGEAALLGPSGRPGARLHRHRKPPRRFGAGAAEPEPEGPSMRPWRGGPV